MQTNLFSKIWGTLARVLTLALLINSFLPVAGPMVARAEEPALFDGVNYFRVIRESDNKEIGLTGDDELLVNGIVRIEWQSDSKNLTVKVKCNGYLLSEALTGSKRIYWSQPTNANCTLEQWSPDPGLTHYRNFKVVVAYTTTPTPTPEFTRTPTPQPNTPTPAPTRTPTATPVATISYFRFFDGNREVGGGAPDTAKDVQAGTQVMGTWETSNAQNVSMNCDQGGPSSTASTGTVHKTWASPVGLVHCTLQWRTDRTEHRYFRVIPVPTATPTTTPNPPTATHTPTATNTPTACPINTPAPTATAIPDNPLITPGESSCQQSLWMPVTIGGGGQSCRSSGLVMVAGADAVLSLPSCMAIPAKILEVCSNMQTEWTFSRGGTQRAVKLSCGNLRAVSDGITAEAFWTVGISLSALNGPAVAAFLAAAAPAVVGVAVIGGFAYLILNIEDAPIVTFDSQVYSADSQKVIDAWLLMQNEGYVSWPKAARRVSTTTTFAAAWYQETWDDNQAVSLVPARTTQNNTEVALVMALTSGRELRAYQLVGTLSEGDTELVRATAKQVFDWVAVSADPAVVNVDSPEGELEMEFRISTEGHLIDWYTDPVKLTQVGVGESEGLLGSLYTWQSGVRTQYNIEASTEPGALPMPEAIGSLTGKRYKDVPLPQGVPGVDPHEGPDVLGRSPEEQATRHEQRAPAWNLAITNSHTQVVQGKPPCDWLGFVSERDTCFCACFRCKIEAIVEGVKDIVGVLQIFSGNSSVQNTAIPLGSKTLPKGWVPGDTTTPPRGAQYQPEVTVRDPLTRAPVIGDDGKPVTRPGPKTVNQSPDDPDFQRCNALLNNIWGPPGAPAAASWIVGDWEPAQSSE